MQKSCPTCGKEFSTRDSTRRYCSRACYWNEGRFEFQCDGCGKTVVAKKSNKKSERHYCSHKCYLKHGLPTATFLQYTCEWCGERYERQKNGWFQKANHHFCCSDCDNAWRRNGNLPRGMETRQFTAVEIPCSYCGNMVLRQQNRLKRSKDHFCGNQCRGAWLAKNRQGPNHPLWSGGWQGSYYGPGWETVAASIRRRDGFRCLCCGISQAKLRRKLDVHHIVPFRDFGYVRLKNDAYKVANKPSNLVSLCRPCHIAIESGQLSLQLPLLAVA